jgi:hypothetical protein
LPPKHSNEDGNSAKETKCPARPYGYSASGCSVLQYLPINEAQLTSWYVNRTPKQSGKSIKNTSQPSKHVPAKVVSSTKPSAARQLTPEDKDEPKGVKTSSDTPQSRVSTKAKATTKGLAKPRRKPTKKEQAAATHQDIRAHFPVRKSTRVPLEQQKVLLWKPCFLEPALTRLR